ncbi:MAG: aminotransferase class V-fold PLP-dependent enzyme [Alphaproteobacteria bacterium]|nr:aminotransferase class V-fold PLP-dependent enzyme [Alphaproteobacteria bacterium]MDE2335946.1 aminotransferase class V-fold PLP-dependent enzyme [Alphaproteobacteria bacterium]
MLDEMFDYLAHLRDQPVWREMPPEVRGHFKTGALPQAPQAIDEVYQEFAQYVLPYAGGNLHPAFMGWVQGGGTPAGMLAEMLAGALNANLGGRDHAPVAVEQQVAAWMRQLFRFPDAATGIFVTGTSQANLIAALIARGEALGLASRKSGAGAVKLRAYASAAAHSCIARAMDFAGLGSDALRLIPFDGRQRIDIAALEKTIAADRKTGAAPFMVVATAGTVDVGAIDDLKAVGAVCRAEKLWFHIDGAYGALGMLAEEIAPRLAGIEAADSIALDFHKWGQAPYDAGFILVRDGEKHKAAFATPAAYLRRETRGMAGGDFWPTDYGPDLSRGFRALKVWFTLKTYGAERMGRMIARTCELARYLEKQVRALPELELLAPADLSIVCFRYRASDAANAEIVADLHCSGIAAPSLTTIGGKRAIRCAIFNHRTEERDIDALLEAVLRFGKARA